MSKEAPQGTTMGGNEVRGMFDQAFRALGESFKVAMKAQEDTVSFWSAAVGKAKPGQAVAEEWVPTAQKSAEEYLRLLEASYRRNAELLKKVIQAQTNGKGMVPEKHIRECLEAYVAVARDNAQDLASTAMRVSQTWTDVLKMGMQHPSQPKTGK